MTDKITVELLRNHFDITLENQGRTPRKPILDVDKGHKKGNVVITVEHDK